MPERENSTRESHKPSLFKGITVRSKKVLFAIRLFVWAVISVAIAAIFVEYSIPISLFTSLSTEALKALVETGASLLAFFGIIAVYAVTSFDSRIDRMEDKILDAEDQDNWLRANRLTNKRQGMIKRKQYAIISIMAALLGFLVSFILSIVALAFKTIDVDASTTSVNYSAVFLANIFATAFLMIGILAIFVMLNLIRKEPEEKTTPIFN
jgi:polyferredoxin